VTALERLALTMYDVE
jgi:hypothetical protein